MLTLEGGGIWTHIILDPIYQTPTENSFHAMQYGICYVHSYPHLSFSSIVGKIRHTNKRLNNINRFYYQMYGREKLTLSSFNR